MPTRAERLRESDFTLCLSAGFFGFFAHTGVIGELEARALRPARITGASAGALAGGLWGMGLCAAQIEEGITSVAREDFWDPGLPVGGLLKGHAFESILDGFLAELGRTRLEQAPVALSLMVWELAKRRGRAVESGSASRAIRASCALPVLFRPVRVDGRWCIDGGASDREATSSVRADERALLCSLPHHSPWPEFGVSDKLTTGPRRWRFEPQELPRVSPWALDRGPAAIRAARQQFANWLDAEA